MIAVGVDPGCSRTGKSCAIARVEMDARRILSVSVTSLRMRSGTFMVPHETRTQFLDRVQVAIAECEPGLVAVEDQTKVAVGAQKRGEWGSKNLDVVMVQGLCHGIGCPVVEVQPQEVKARFAMCRNAGKPQVGAGVAVLLQRNGINIKLSEHEADAVAIAVTGYGVAGTADRIARSKGNGGA